MKIPTYMKDIGRKTKEKEREFFIRCMDMFSGHNLKTTRESGKELNLEKMEIGWKESIKIKVI